MYNIPETAICLIDSHHGIYVPQFFAELEFHHPLENVDREDLETLQVGPDHEWYWETWYDSVEPNAIVTDNNGKRYTLWHDGDLWLVPEDAEWEDGQ